MAACKDVMASYVKQLLELDESKRRATLESLSKYQFKDVDSSASPGSSSDSSSTAGPLLAAPRKVTPSAALSKLEPAMIELPPGLDVSSKGLSAEAPTYLPTTPLQKAEQEQAFWKASMQLKQAGSLFQVALADWDSCNRWGEAAQATVAPREAQEMQEAGMRPTPGLFEPMRPEVDVNISLSRVATPPVAGVKDNSPGSAAEAARSDEKPQTPQTSERLVGMLEKALSELTNSLPPEAATEAQKVLGAVVEQANKAKPQGKGQDLEGMKWLMQHLEKQQEASVHKLFKLLGANGAAAMGASPLGASPLGASSLGASPLSASPLSASSLGASSLSASPTDSSRLASPMSVSPMGASAFAAGAQGMGGLFAGKPLAPPGLAAPAAVPRAMGWGCLEQQMAMQGCMAEQSFMAMHGGCPPWWSQGCVPMAPASPARAPRQQMGACRRPMVPQGLAGGLQQQQQTLLAADNTDGSAGMQTGETLRMHLRSLIKIDSGRILIVRKINRLGFSSPELLEQHYSWYGTVERVLVAHSRVKSSALAGREAGNKLASRLRPSGLGFVVMSKAEEAEAILAMGQEQIVCGAVIRVQQFERRMSDMEEANMEEGQENEELTFETNSSEEQQSA